MRQLTKQLIADIKAAQWPFGGELDARVARFFGAEATRHRNGWRIRNEPWRDYDTSRWTRLPDFLSTVEDALALLPKGAFFFCGAGRTRPDEPLYGASIVEPGHTDKYVELGVGEHPDRLAAAIVIAAIDAAERATFGAA